MKKKLIIAGITAFIIAAAAAFMIIPDMWSKQSFEGVVQEVVTMQDGEVRFIVQRTTKVYSTRLNSLHIGQDTELIGIDGEKISRENISPGDTVKVTLKDSFVEETPFYYPTVYEVMVVGSGDQGMG